MTFEEYTEKLSELREYHASLIEKYSTLKDPATRIHTVAGICHDYTNAVTLLIEQYQSGKVS